MRAVCCDTSAVCTNENNDDEALERIHKFREYTLETSYFSLVSQLVLTKLGASSRSSRSLVSALITHLLTLLTHTNPYVSPA
jgi:hypothetical protein